MARTIETLRKSEARIIVYLINTDLPLHHGRAMSDKLNIDYAYVMKICEQMFNKGWLTTKKYNNTLFFGITITAPMAESKAKLMNEQTQLKHDD